MTGVQEPTRARFARAPSACGDEFEKVAWSGTIAVLLPDGTFLGVRFNDDALQEHVARALGERVHPHPEPVPYYSVRLGTPGRRKAAPLHHLYLGARPVLGTRDVGRLVGGLARHLSAHLAPPEGLVVEAVPVGTPHGVLLVPPEILAMPGSVDRLLTPAGFGFADIPRALLHPDDGTVEVPAPVVDLDTEGAPIGERGRSVREERLPTGTHRLAGWLVGVGAGETGPLRTAPAVAHVARLIHPPFRDGAQATLDGLVGLASRLPFRGIAWATHDELVSQVLAAGTSGIDARWTS